MLTKTKKNYEYFNFQNFKNPKRSFVRTIEKKIQEKFETFRLRFVGVAFWNFLSHVNEKYS